VQTTDPFAALTSFRTMFEAKGIPLQPGQSQFRKVRGAGRGSAHLALLARILQILEIA